jgi:hypothetical protein
VPTSERDADEYAWQGALPPALKAKAYLAVAGRPLGRRWIGMPGYDQHLEPTQACSEKSTRGV